MIKNTLYFTALILAILFVMAVFSKSEGATQLEYTSPDITEITLKKIRFGIAPVLRWRGIL